jgi:hypothetical protein
MGLRRNIQCDRGVNYRASHGWDPRHRGKPPYTFGDNQRVSTPNPRSSSDLTPLIHQAIAQAGGWIGYDRFMAMAL